MVETTMSGWRDKLLTFRLHDRIEPTIFQQVGHMDQFLGWAARRLLSLCGRGEDDGGEGEHEERQDEFEDVVHAI